MREWWWRVRYVWYFRRATGFPWSFCVSAAWAGDYWPDYTPAESVDEELTYWTE